MKLFKLWNNFKNDESGAVTVDWVVLTAALVGLGLAVVVAIRPGIESAADSIYDDLKESGTATTATITVTD
jgi:hypothetical protein